MSMTDKQNIVAAFIKMRRSARKVAETLDLLSINSRTGRRAVKRAEALAAAGRFPINVLSNMRASLAEAEESQRRARTAQVKFGSILLDILLAIDELLSLDERYDLFNVNRAHRQWDETAAPSSLEMILVHGLEDSSVPHSKEWLDGPLFACLHANMWNFFTTDARGRVALDFMTYAAFAPGGPFEHVTLQRVGPDGTVEDVPPSERAKPPAGATLH
ncbi:hypothetical protein [Achromobacter mucicolens]|uniref:hypothetical protein n=1 Tax=Achromobacter mucicolens TaxID=1389922 RepID=UPI0028A27CE5|nr:hypothetical protein [Achromobacter mucicolens]